MTDAAAARRVERASAPSGPRRGGVAAGSKVAAAGFGFAAMLGLVAAMGYADTSAAVAPPTTPSPTAPPQVLVVIHPAEGSAPPATAATPGTGAATTSPPMVLTAQPVVRQAPAAQAPAAQVPTGQTNGSR